MYIFLFLPFFFISFFSVLHGMDSMPKNTLSKSELQQKWQTLQHPGNQLVPPTNINKKIAQYMIRHINFYPFVKSIQDSCGARPTGWSADGKKLLVNGFSNSLMVDRTTGKILYVIPYGLAQLSPDKSKIFACNKVWDVESGRLVFKGRGSSHYNTRMVFTQDGTKMAYHASGSIDIVNTQNWKCITTIKADYLRNFIFTPDDKKLLVSWGNCAKFFDVKNGQQLSNVYSPLSCQKSIMSPDGSMYATWKYGMVRVFNTKNWKQIKQLPVSNVKAYKFQFSPDEQFLFINIGRDITVWNTQTWKCVFTQKNCQGLSFIPNSDNMFVELGGSHTVGHNSIGILSTQTWQVIQTFKDACAPTSFDGVHCALLTIQNKEKPFWHYDLQVHHMIDGQTQQWLHNDLLPEQARIIARAYESQQKGKRLVLTSQGAIDIFNSFPVHVKKYLIARFGILTELKKQSRRSERLRNKKRKRDGESSGNAKRIKLNSGNKK